MKEIEQVMQEQDIFSEFSGSLSSPMRTKKHCCDTPKVATPEKIPERMATPIKKEMTIDKETTDKKGLRRLNICEWCNLSNKGDELEFLYAFVSVNVKDKVLPQSFLKDGVTVENVCKFLSAKVKLMQEQIDKLQANIEKMNIQCEKHMSQLAELESEKLLLINKTNNIKSEIIDVKAKYAAVNNRCNEKDRLYKEQRSATDKLTTEVKNLRCKNANLEARCASQEETIANLKQQIDTAKLSEKEFRDATRNLSASHQNAICRLEAKVKCLTTRIDRQMALIDNLKKQNALLSTEGALKAFEKDYNDFLNSDL